VVVDFFRNADVKMLWPAVVDGSPADALGVKGTMGARQSIRPSISKSRESTVK